MSAITKEEVKEIVDQALAEHEEREQARYDSSMEKLRHELVPDGKPAPHKEYHQRKLDAAKAEQEAWETRKLMYEAVISRLAAKGLDGAVNLLWVIILMGLLAVTARLGFSLPDWAWSMIKGGV